MAQERASSVERSRHRDASLYKSSIQSESFSQSNEADDERTPSEASSSMGPNSSAMQAAPDMPRYEGEDISLTSKKELRGFFMYGWAAEVFVVCGMASFIPITLEQLARERGWVEGNRSQSCKAGLEMPGNSYRNSTPIAHQPHEVRQCLVDFLGFEINTASFAMYTFSVSVLVQALLIISISAAADHGKLRRTLLVIFAFIGSIATMLFLPVVPEYLGWGAVLAITANTAFGASFVLLNSFLPLLVRHHPSVQEPSSDSSEEEEEDVYEVEVDEDGIPYPEETTSLLNRTQPVLKIHYPPPPITTSRELHVSTRISSFGMGIGYIAALIVQAASIFTVRVMKSSLLSLRVALFMIGAWWFVFTIPAAMWLRSRPGPPLHLNPHQSRFGSGWAYFAYSWKSLWRSVKQARRLKDCLLFLGAWFLLSDAIATVSGTAILFAKTSLEMQPAALALITVTATLSGIAGAFSWSKVSNMMGIKPTHTILACILLFEVIPIYGLLGYIPAVRRWGVIGLQQPWEMYPLGIVYGFVMGGLSSFCRSLFGELIPPGFEAAFYALYAITDKGSSIFGPAIVGAITDAYGEIRPAFFFLAILIGLPFPLMLFVDVDRGRREAIALAKELEEAEALDASIHFEPGPVHLVDDDHAGVNRPTL